MPRFFLGLGMIPLLVLSPLVGPVGDALGRELQPKRQVIDRRGSSLPRYNFPAATRGDRFARRGLNLKVGIKGWRRYGGLIKRVAKFHGIDPYVLGAYVWLESEFNPKQDYVNGPKRALGLGSVQATDFPQFSVQQLQQPHLNLTLTAKEFRHKWNSRDMYGTVMDVWYPRWRKRVASGEKLPVVKTPGTYVQAIANRFYALQDIDRHLRPSRPLGKPFYQSRPVH